MTPYKKNAVYALAMLGLFGGALMVFVLAASEQSVVSNGLPAASRISLHDLVANGPVTNTHVELVDFSCGKTFIYATELIQFNEVYVPLFARGEPEDGAHLRLLLLIRNDRHSNEPLIQTREELDGFVGELNRNPTSVTGVLQQPISRVRSLAADAYPGTDGQSLQVLWARTFPTQSSANVFWGLCALCLGGTVVFAFLLMRQRRRS